MLGWVFLVSGSPEENRISVYSSVAQYSAAINSKNNIDYVGLMDLIEPLGNVTAKVSGERWALRYNDVQCEFQAGKTRARVRGSDFDLPNPFLIENGRGLVPVSSLSTLLPRIVGGPIVFNQNARRLLIGNVAVHFTAEVTKTAPPKLVMNFSAPVNPIIATEPGKVRMVFNHDPVVAPGSQTLTFGSTAIPSASFQESNGQAELVVMTTNAAMATFSNDGRTITIAPPIVAVSQTQNPAPAQTPTQTAAPAVIASSETTGAAQHIFAVIDAAHGGDERGAALTDQLAEKDVTLAFARRLRQEFIARGLTTSLVRDGDTTLTLDQRAAMSNATGASLYLSIHATSEGNGVRLYSALLPAGGENRGLFVDWDTAQSSSEGLSQATEASVAAELRNKQIAVRALIAPLRPLNNVVSAAIAVEVGPPAGGVSQLNSPQYFGTVAEAIGSGVAGMRDKLQAAHK